MEYEEYTPDFAKDRAATIYTWGYQGGTAADLRQYLTATGALLADIRFSPNSRQPEWTRETLVQRHGDAYRWIPALGNVNYRTGGLIQLKDVAGGLAVLRPVLAAPKGARPILLMCGCWDVQTCHRRDAAAYLSAALDAPVEHLPGRFAKWPGAVGLLPADPVADRTVRVLSLTQPWASLVAVGAKSIETRSWGTPYRGRLAIHAAKGLAGGTEVGLGITCRQPAFARALRAADYTDVRQLERGAIVALCDLMDCVRITPENTPPEPECSFGDYTPGRWAWHLANVRRLPEPIPARGSLGLWTWELPEGVAVTTAGQEGA